MFAVVSLKSVHPSKLFLSETSHSCFFVAQKCLLNPNKLSKELDFLFILWLLLSWRTSLLFSKGVVFDKDLEKYRWIFLRGEYTEMEHVKGQRLLGKPKKRNGERKAACHKLLDAQG